VGDPGAGAGDAEHYRADEIAARLDSVARMGRASKTRARSWISNSLADAWTNLDFAADVMVRIISAREATRNERRSTPDE
jgi:uncharacterized DUF497 family protein